MTGIQRTAQLIQTPTWRSKILGERFFGNLNLLQCLIIAVLAGAALFFVGVRTHVFGKDYLMTSYLGGISFAILLFINSLIDRRRT